MSVSAGFAHCLAITATAPSGAGAMEAIIIIVITRILLS